MLEALQLEDPQVESIVLFSKTVVAYRWEEDAGKPGWRKANIEGPLYVLRRSAPPRYRLLLRNTSRPHEDLLDDLHVAWRLECQKNYVFYKVEQSGKPIRCLSFCDDAERERVETTLQRALQELCGQSEGQLEPGPEEVAPQPLQAGEVTVTPELLRAALHAMAEDEAFIQRLLEELEAWALWDLGPAPLYLGVDVDAAMAGARGAHARLWLGLSSALAGRVEPWALDLGNYHVPNPLHVTTFHRRELRGQVGELAMADAACAEGQPVSVTLEALAFLVGGLACAVATRAEPSLAVPQGKLLHVTLASRPPWQSAQCNELLAALLGPRPGGLGLLQEEPPRAPGPPEEAQEAGGLACFRGLDLSGVVEPVYSFEQLEVTGLKCTAFLVRLPEPVVVRGVRFCCPR